jgi:membrane protease subunit (stomatin/prohibitin family)
MGIFNNNNDGGIMDVIRCDEPDYLIWKWHPSGTSSKSSQRANAIRWGSSLRVRDGSVAVFVYTQSDDIAQDFIEGPYDEIIETNNFPVLASLVGKLFKGGSPFQAEVYFINLANLIQVKFGVPYFDVFDPRFLDFGVPTAVRGSLNFKIADYREFIKLHRLDEFDMSAFQAQIKDTIIRYVKSVVSNAPEKHGIPVVQLERQISEINALIEKELRENLERDFGVSVTRVDISDIELDKNSVGYKKLQSLTQNKVAMFTQGAANIVDTMSTHRSGAKKIVATAKGEDTSQGFNISGVGQKMSSAIGNVFGGKKGKSTPPPIPTTGFYVAIDGKQKGPYDTTKLSKMISENKFSSESLVWKEGMENWTKASDIEELASLFSIAPPIPNTID